MWHISLVLKGVTGQNTTKDPHMQGRVQDTN